MKSKAKIALIVGIVFLCSILVAGAVAIPLLLKKRRARHSNGVGNDGNDAGLRAGGNQEVGLSEIDAPRTVNANPSFNRMDISAADFEQLKKKKNKSLVFVVKDGCGGCIALKAKLASMHLKPKHRVYLLNVKELPKMDAQFAKEIRFVPAAYYVQKGTVTKAPSVQKAVLAIL